MGKKEVENNTILKYAIGAAICVLVIWALTFFLFFIDDSEERGQIGDMFGVVNALFSGLAFAGLIITLILQKTELGLQRDELEQTREELKNQRLEFETQNETLKYQRFENLFYNMLNLQQEIVAGLRYEYEADERSTVQVERGFNTEHKRVKREVVGRDVFRYLFTDVRIIFDNRRLYGYEQYLQFRGLQYYDDMIIPSHFDHYFRHLYKIVQFVDAQGFKFDEAYKYISLLRGTLSRYELVWIYYNALNPEFHNFQELIEKYSLLKNMREYMLTMSHETFMFFQNNGFVPQNVKDAGFSGTDFELYLTDDKNDAEKYYLTAFWKESDIQRGQDLLNRWRAFVGDVARKSSQP